MLHTESAFISCDPFKKATITLESLFYVNWRKTLRFIQSAGNLPTHPDNLLIQWPTVVSIPLWEENVFLRCVFLSPVLFIFRLPAFSFADLQRGSNAERTMVLVLIFQKVNFQTSLVYSLIFIPSCFFITNASEQIHSQETSPPATMQLQLGTKCRIKSYESGAIFFSTNQGMGFCAFMWAPGFSCCGPVMVMLLF